MFLARKFINHSGSTCRNYTAIKIPNTIKIAIDVDLTDSEMTNFVIPIVVNEKLTCDNLSYIHNQAFKIVVSNYSCDICKIRCSIVNPIYTNNKYMGADICSTCINKAFKSIEPDIKFYPGSVYKLRDILKNNV